MPRRVNITPEQIDWLREVIDTKSLQEISRTLSICVDTLKRILNKHGIKEFEAAKYLPSERHDKPKTKTRRCLACGIKKQFKDNLWICDTCKRSHQSIHVTHLRVSI